MATTVVNVHREPYDIRIGRPSKWGNPFILSQGNRHNAAARAKVIAAYEEWIKTQPKLLAALHELKGKRLGCFCKPQACHGDVLARLADAS